VVGVLEIAARMTILKWVFVVIVSLVGGSFIAGIQHSVFVAVFGPVRGITEILWLLTWVLSGIAICVGLVKGMTPRASPPPITEDREDK